MIDRFGWYGLGLSIEIRVERERKRARRNEWREKD
jgi:hypothetical protein